MVEEGHTFAFDCSTLTFSSLLPTYGLTQTKLDLLDEENEVPPSQNSRGESSLPAPPMPSLMLERLDNEIELELLSPDRRQ